MATEPKTSASSGLASSLTDLMTSLMVIFVLLLVATLNNASAEGENTRNVILDVLKKDFASTTGVVVEKDPRDPLGLIVVVPEKFFNFALNKSDIPEGGIEFLGRFAPRLAGITCGKQYHDEISSIVVEGHTDSTGTDERNLQLSQERSLKVVQQTLTILGEDNVENKKCFLDFLSANGRGSREPLKLPNGEEDRDRSRRVVFKIRVRSLEQREIRTLLGM